MRVQPLRVGTGGPGVNETGNESTSSPLALNARGMRLRTTAAAAALVVKNRLSPVVPAPPTGYYNGIGVGTAGLLHFSPLAGWA